MHANTVHVVAEANSVTTAIEAVDRLKPDLLLLDIQLGDGSGFDVIARTAYKQFKVIFITAYNEYAIQAFRINALDYLLKPINKKQLSESIERLSLVSINNHFERLQSMMQQIELNHPKKIGFSTSEGYSLHNIDDIIRCESDNNYCTIYFVGNEKLYIAKTLKELEEQLAVYGFERIQQSHLINLKHLKKYLGRDEGTVVMSDGSQVPVAQRKRSQLISLLENFSI
jgi:two-component system LytT family response regulator